MKDFLVILLYGTALFIAVKIGFMWWQGKLNQPAIWEWFCRGYFFAWGVLTATLVLFLIIKLIVENVK